jgi:Mrr N-terminal domain
MDRTPLPSLNLLVPNMPITREEEVAVLYALYCCGGKASKSRAVEFILRNELLQPRDGDDDIVSSNESRIANRIAWSRENLKEKGQLSMPQIGTWQITQSGRDRLLRLANRLHEDTAKELRLFDDLVFDRFTFGFLDRLRALGARLAQPSPPKD